MIEFGILPIDMALTTCAVTSYEIEERDVGYVTAAHDVGQTKSNHNRLNITTLI